MPRFDTWPAHLRLQAAVTIVEQLTESPTEREAVITMLARLSDLGPAGMCLLTPDYGTDPEGGTCRERV